MPVLADDGVSLHVSGASYGAVSDRNPFNGARAVPDVGRLELVLNTSARTFDERVGLEAQLFIVRQASELDFFTTQIDYAFGELRLSDGLRVRAGAPKLPFGLLNETRNVAIVRLLPDISGVYANLGFLTENYQGIGAVGRVDLDSVGIVWDVYGGWATSTDVRPWYGVVQSQSPAMAGGRALFELPWPGATVATSLALTYDGSVNDDTSLGRVMIGASGELRDEILTLRSEIFIGNEFEVLGRPDVQLLQSYLEAGVRPWPFLELAVRGEFAGARVLTADPALVEVQPTSPLPTRHVSAEVGATWWPDPRLAVRTSVALIDGNMYVNGYGRDGVVLLPQTDLSRVTRVGQISAAFAF
jgi:hypothetical protein